MDWGKIMKVTVLVKIKEEVSDPQSMAITEALNSMGFPISKIRMGKIFDIDLEEKDIDNAKSKIDIVAKEILSNPIVENYEVKIGEI